MVMQYDIIVMSSDDTGIVKSVKSTGQHVKL